jgi:hypothetical protein
MNPNVAADLDHARAAIIQDVATVLRDTNSQDTNIESAIARSGVAMHEISAKFGGARQLVLAMVSELSDSMSAPLSARSTRSDLRQRLVEFARGLTDTYATSHLRALYRIAITESIRHTGLGRDFYEIGPRRVEQRLAEFLQRAQSEGTLRAADPCLLASHLLSLLRANVDAIDTFPEDLASSPPTRDAYAHNAVDLFCDGINQGRPSC